VDVSAQHVLDFFKSYKTPPGADRANTLVMAEFVGQMNSVGELQKWSVALLAEGRKAPAGYEFSPVVSVDSFPSRGDTGVEGRWLSCQNEHLQQQPDQEVSSCRYPLGSRLSTISER
jgi:hypothetical protein